MAGAVADFSNIWKSVKAVPPVQTDPGIFTPQQLGQYKLLHSIGEGEFAKVQACRRLRGSDEVLAAKHIVKSKLISTSNVKRTVRRVKRVGTEIEAMRLIDDQFVCKLLDVIHTPDYVHLIMEKGGCDLCVLRTR